MNIKLLTQKIGSIFATNLQAALKEMGHNCIRSTKDTGKRYKIFNIDQEAIGKVAQLAKFVERSVSCVPYTTNKAEALAWSIDGDTVICRTLTNAHSGEGIVIAEKPEDVVAAPLYTKYVKKFAEFRVHVFEGKVIFIQQKKAKSDAVEDGTINYKIRNHQFGWVFSHQDLEIPDQPQLEAVAKAALRAVGYRFGAVDIIYNKRENLYRVLEVNSRPGIEGATAFTYAQAVVDFVEKQSAKGTKKKKGVTEIVPCSALVERCEKMKVEVFQMTEVMSIENYLRAACFAYDRGLKTSHDTHLGEMDDQEQIWLFPEIIEMYNSYLDGTKGE